MRRMALAAIGVSLASVLAGQSSPFVDEKTERLLVNELSGDLAFEHMRITTQWHKPSGSEGFFAVARYVLEKAKEAGLQDVRWIDQASDTASWTCRRADAWLLEGDAPEVKETRLGSYSEVATSIADYSRTADVTAPLVDVGAGDRASDYEGKDVKGKIVLAYGSPSAVTEQAVWKRGALGILSYASTRLNPLADAPDQVAWQRVPEKDGPNGEKTTFAFILSAREGKALSDRLKGEGSRRIFAEGEGGATPSLRAHIVVESSTLPEKKTAMVEAKIPGADPALPEIVLTSHLQEEKFSANDNQSGVANMLEIGRALTRLISDGKLPRPRRGIRLWWCDEIRSEYRYFADHPGEEKKILANLNQDMVGAKQSVGGRTQYMARTPWSRPSYLSDVQESILDMVVAGNNAYLAAWQAGSIPPGVPFSKPIFSHMGTREPFHARAVPYFDSTDHLVFDDSWVGVPGTTLTNWPDENIHSSSDDLWQMDATQLKRNSFIVAATAWWLANADSTKIPEIASFAAARGLERLGHDLTTGIEWIRAGRGTPEERYRAASNLLEVSLEKEKAAMDSIRAIAAGEPATVLADRKTELERAGSNTRAQLDAAFSAMNPGVTRPKTELDEVERRLQGRVPKRFVQTLSEWLVLERKVRNKRAEESRVKREEREREAAAAKSGKPRGPRKPKPREPEEKRLSSLMQFEAMNWIDGKTDALEIARRVCAEALSAGAWYYGAATPLMVEKFFETQAKDGLITW